MQLFEHRKSHLQSSSLQMTCLDLTICQGTEMVKPVWFPGYVVIKGGNKSPEAEQVGVMIYNHTYNDKR